MTISLIGFQGAGKTSLAKRLSKELSLDFTDTDLLVEREYDKGMSCRQIFMKEGELFFRQLEDRVITALPVFDRHIISFGGGSSLDLVRKKTSLCIYLYMSQEKALIKMRQKGGVFVSHSFQPFYSKRNRLYLNCADTIFNALSDGVFVNVKQFLEKNYMASNSFGNLFRITTFGESHGKGIGVVIDGCPANFKVCQKELSEDMRLRSGGRIFTTPRVEPDVVEILSGVFEGKTTGHPIALFIKNKNADSSAYDALKEVVRPSHADFTYLKKYGIFDHRGAGRASARETAARVAAGYFAKKLLSGIHIYSYVHQIGDIYATASDKAIKESFRGSIFCPDVEAERKMIELLTEVKNDGDSIGGVLACIVDGVDVGLGEPMYHKFESLIASAMMSIPASRGVEFGCGFNVCMMRGSEHNDQMNADQGFLSNHAGGILGGISTGQRIFFRVAFKPASSIKKTQETIKTDASSHTYTLDKKARHDPCVCIRAVPIVESMTALVLADLTLQNCCH